MMVVRVSIGFLNNMRRETSRLSYQIEAETVIYRILRDVRNARTILTIEPTRLQVTSFNTKGGFDTNINQFYRLGHSTITYQVLTDATNSLYLSRVTEYSPTNKEEMRFLKGFITQPSTSKPLFQPLLIYSGPPPVYEEPPYDSVDVQMSLLPKFNKQGSTITYSVQATRRTWTN
jgi:hypothetical protein